MDSEDYRTAVEAAHVQFAMSLLTPALRNYIWSYGRYIDVDDVNDKDFIKCCKFIMSEELVKLGHICFFEDAVDLRNDVSHQNFQSSDENIKSLVRIATCIQREDVADSIREFTVSRKRSESDDNRFVSSPVSTPTSSAPVSLASSPSNSIFDSYQSDDFSLLDFPSPRFRYDN